MKRKDYKLLVEGWRKVISEGFDDDGDDGIDISDDSLDFDAMTADSVDEVPEESSEDSIEEKIASNSAEIDRFCKLMGISPDELEDFLRGQAFRGDDEGVQYDEFGEELDFDDMEEH